MQIKLLRDNGRTEFAAWSVLEFAEQDRRHVMEIFHMSADAPFGTNFSMRQELGRAVLDNRRILAADFS